MVTYKMATPISWLTLVIALLFGTLGYFSYGESTQGFFALFILTLLLSLTTLVAAIPFVGVFVYAWIVMPFLSNAVFSSMGLSPNTLFGAVTILYLIFGAITCIATSILAILGLIYLLTD